MFSWFGELLERFGSIIPRLELIAVTHGGVKFGRGGKVTELKPGLHWYWPLMTVIEVYPTARTTMDLKIQTIHIDSEKQTVIVSASLVYKVRNVVKAFADNYDIEDTIDNVARSVVAEYVREGKRNGELTKRVHEKLTKYGIDVQSCIFTDYAPCKVIRNVCDVSDINLGEE